MAPAGAGAPPKPASAAACAAPAGPPHATAGMPGQGSSGARHGQERCGCDGSRSAGTAPTAPAPGHTPLAAGEPARSPVFCGNFLHHLDLEITLGHQLLQPRVLRLELPQAPYL